MVDKNLIESNINNVLTDTNLPNIGEKISGKVRDIYDLGDRVLFITTDRQSAFDRNIALVPFKGQVLTQASVFWFNATKHIIPNHFISTPDPSVMVAKKLKIFPIEFVVRGYLTGVTSTSAWTAYQKGIRDFCGNRLPEGMVKNQPFDAPILTPTTKSDEHDEQITPDEILSQNIMSEKDWNACSEYAIKIFTFSQELLKKQGLILVDTKYEFGYDEEGNIYLCDEVHTPDSSRFWIQNSYKERFKVGQEPENIDKEFLRLWFKDNCDPYNDKVLPEAPHELVVELSAKYIQAFEMITGAEFQYHTDSISVRLETNLKQFQK